MSVLVAPVSTADHEITAVNLQLAEFSLYDESKKGKYNPANPPDIETAYQSLHDDLQAELQFWEDLKLAHSIACAINADAGAIGELLLAENRDSEDHELALRISGAGTSTAVPSHSLDTRFEHGKGEDDILDRLSVVHGFDDDDDDEAVAGPSGSYVKHQNATLGKLSSKAFHCTACTDSFRYADIVRLKCGDEYCVACLKTFIMHGVVDHDLALLPPRCCGVNVEQDVIANVLSEQELIDFRSAEVEKATKHKLYCSNGDCGKFIPPDNLVAGTATCPQCGIGNCSICRSPAHENDCPADPDIQATIALGHENQWQRCPSCHSLVSLDFGCNHMTCHCSAEFCYHCGREWRNHSPGQCPFWAEANLVRRAEEVVDREGRVYMEPAQRQRRIAQIQEELRDTDECDHRGRKKFARIDGGYGVPQFRCEMCNTRHRLFILRCRRCQLDLCMDCPRHRV